MRRRDYPSDLTDAELGANGGHVRHEVVPNVCLGSASGNETCCFTSSILPGHAARAI
jgi:hypothetical protein